MQCMEVGQRRFGSSMVKWFVEQRLVLRGSGWAFERPWQPRPHSWEMGVHYQEGRIRSGAEN